VLASSAYRAGIEPRLSALSAYRALEALLAPFGRPTQLTLRPRAARAGFRFTDVVTIIKLLVILVILRTIFYLIQFEFIPVST